MRIKANLSLGKSAYQFDIEEKDEKQALFKAITLASPPTYCDVCKNSDRESFKLTANKDKESNIYINVKCKCGAKCKLGEYKDGTGYFWRRPFEVWKREGSASALPEGDINDFTNEDAPM